MTFPVRPRVLARLRIPLSAALLLAALLPAACAQRTGGPCDYETFPARGEVLEVVPDPDAPQAARTGYQGLLVTYELMGDPNILGMRNVFTVKIRSAALGDVDPGPQWVRKYRVHPGRQFDVTVARIVSGTCTPVIATPTELDVTDDFELHAPKHP